MLCNFFKNEKSSAGENGKKYLADKIQDNRQKKACI